LFIEMEASTSKSRGANYKPHEDRLLCLAWLNVSCDPISGIYQKGDDFYAKVKAAFDDELQRQSHGVIAVVAISADPPRSVKAHCLPQQGCCCVP
jgi:hypothetical protein